MSEPLPDNDEKPQPAPRSRERRGERVRLWIAITLAAIVLTLFGIMKYYDVVAPSLDEMADARNRTALDEMEIKVQESLRGFGILPEWIEKRSVTLPDYGKIRAIWKVYTPMDVPLASLNQELTVIAESHSAESAATEDLKSGRVTVYIKQGAMVIFTVELLPDPEKARTGGVVALMFDGLESAPESELDALAQSNEPIACVFEPTLDVYELYNRLKGEKKEMVFHFHINPEKRTKSRFEFYEDMPPAAIQRRLRFLLQNYPDVRSFYITTELVPGTATEVMADELGAHGLRQVHIDDMVYLDRSLSEEQLSARMNDLAAVSARRGYVIGVVRLKSGVVEFITSELIRLRKKGYHCYSLGNVLRLRASLEHTASAK